MAGCDQFLLAGLLLLMSRRLNVDNLQQFTLPTLLCNPASVMRHNRQQQSAGLTFVPALQVAIKDDPRRTFPFHPFGIINRRKPAPS